MGDEKWVLYNTVQCKRQGINQNKSPQLTPKIELHERKVILHVWLDHGSIIHFEFLDCSQILNEDL